MTERNKFVLGDIVVRKFYPGTWRIIGYKLAGHYGWVYSVENVDDLLTAEGAMELTMDHDPVAEIRLLAKERRERG